MHVQPVSSVEYCGEQYQMFYCNPGRQHLQSLLSHLVIEGGEVGQEELTHRKSMLAASD